MIGKTTVVNTPDLTTEMLNVAVASGLIVHSYKAFFVTSTKKGGVISVTPRDRTAAGVRLHDTRRINSPQANEAMINIYGERVIKDSHGRRVIKLAYI